MNKLLTILLIFITSLSFAQIKDTLKVGQYAISTLGTNDYVNKITVPTIITSKYGVLKADTVFYVPSTAPNDTITTLMNARPSKKRAAILFERGSVRKTTISLTQDSISFGTYGNGYNPSFTAFTTITGWTNEGGGIYSKVLSVDSSPEIVTKNGVQCAMGRTPNANRYVPAYADYYHIDSHTGTTSITDSECSAAITDWDNAEIVIRTGNHMNWFRSTISNHTGTTLTFTNTDNLSITDGYGYFIQNDLRTLDQLGEYYYGGGKFYMYFGAANPDDYVIKVSTKDKIIDINSRDYITVKNIDFTGANVAAIATGYSLLTTNVSVLGCNFDFNNRGVYGHLAPNMTVRNCSFKRNANMAIYQHWYSDGTYFGYNTIDSTGLVIGSGKGENSWYQGIGAYINYAKHTYSSKNAIIEYNSVKNSGYMGIVFAGDTAICRYNFVDKYNLNKSDGGAIYYGGQATFTNAKILNNIVSNGFISDELLGTATNTASWGSYNIYIDYNSSYVTVDRNTSSSGVVGVFIHMSDHITVTNNTIYDCTTGVRMQELTGYSRPVRNVTMNNNIIVSKKPAQETISLRSLNNDFASNGTINNNYYAKPFSIDPLFVTMVNTFTKTARTFSDYKTYTSQDASSTASTIQIQNDDSIRFYTNPTNTAVVYALNDTLRDATGAAYNTSVTVPAYGSKVLWNDDLASYTPKYLGISAVGGSTASLTTRTAVPYTMTENGKIVAMRIYLNMNGSSKANRIKLAVYDNTGSGGKPGTKLAETNVVYMSDIIGWLTVNLQSELSVTNGQTIWLSWIQEKTASTYYTSGTPGYAWTTGNTWADGLPSTYGTSTQNNNLFTMQFIYR